MAGRRRRRSRRGCSRCWCLARGLRRGRSSPLRRGRVLDHGDHDRTRFLHRRGGVRNVGRWRGRSRLAREECLGQVAEGPGEAERGQNTSPCGEPDQPESAVAATPLGVVGHHSSGGGDPCGLGDPCGPGECDGREVGGAVGWDRWIGTGEAYTSTVLCAGCTDGKTCWAAICGGPLLPKTSASKTWMFPNGQISSQAAVPAINPAVKTITAKLAARFRLGSCSVEPVFTSRRAASRRTIMGPSSVGPVAAAGGDMRNARASGSRKP